MKHTLRWLALLLLVTTALGANPDESELLTDWKISLKDANYFAVKNYDDKSWQSITLPANLIKSEVKPNQYIWLRTSFNPSSASDGNQALRFTALFDEAEVYLNGKLLCKTNRASLKSAINGHQLLCPIKGYFSDSEENVLAIRLRGFQMRRIGILNSAPQLISIARALNHDYTRTFSLFFYALLHIFLALVFLLLWRKRRYQEDVASFGWFGLFQLAWTGAILSDHNWGADFFGAILIKNIIFALSASLIPFSLFKLVYNFIPEPETKINRLLPVAALLTALLTFVSAIFYHPLYYTYAPEFILVLFLPLLVLSTRAIVIEFRATQERRYLFILLGIAILTYYFLALLLARTDIWPGLLGGYNLPLLCALALGFALVYESIQQRLSHTSEQKAARRRQSLREEIFHHLTTLIQQPASELIDLGFQYIKEKKGGAKIAAAMINLTDGIEHKLSEIIELNSLALKRQQEAFQTINLYDFLTENFSRTNFRLRLDFPADRQVYSQPELLSSFIEHLTGFSGFENFNPLDLTVTINEAGEIRVQLLLFHNSIEQTQKLYELCSDGETGSDPGWIKWQIITETARLLSGHTEVRLLQRKYLHIAFIFSAGGDERSESQSTITLLRTDRAVDDEEIPTTAARNDVAPQTAKQLTPFSANMTLGEFSQAVKERINLRRKS